MKYLITNKTGVPEPKNWPTPTQISTIQGLQILHETDTKIGDIENGLFLHDGYIRDLDQKKADIPAQLKSICKAVRKDWPLPSNISGSFSATLLDFEAREIILATDQVGLYPLYYIQKGVHFFISNSIILIGGVSRGELDEAGIVQRCLGPGFATIGSRTIVKGCKRLLPGEYLKWDSSGNLIQKKYDNRLFQQIIEPSKSGAEEYWRAYKKEVEYCVAYSEKVNVALSGGIDSRVVLGAVPGEKEIRCYTYGDIENYETKLAEKLCKIKKGKFFSCSNPSLYFPDPQLFKEYVLKTEALELPSWMEITESVPEKKGEPLLLGELCEALPARNIKRFSGKEYRKRNFIKYFLKKENHVFTEANKANFEEWKAEVIHQFTIYYHQKNLDKFGFKTNREELLQTLLSDLQELFSRVEAHQLPFSELYDELFSWYTYTRMHLAKHLLVAGTKFDAYSPAMSLQMLTFTSRIHPNMRLNYRFAKELFKKNEDLKLLAEIPTAQAPLVPYHFPDIIKFAMWGIRSTADQYLIHQMMKKGDSSLKYRLFRSINWAKVYHHPKMAENLRSYFSPNLIGNSFFQDILNQANARKELREWPFANLNIINAASLNMELNSIRDLSDGPL